MIPLVHSVSYGNDEAQQTSVAYMESVNAEFQKIGVRGVSILFASGDQGVLGREGGGAHFHPVSLAPVHMLLRLEEQTLPLHLPSAQKKHGLTEVVASVIHLAYPHTKMQSNENRKAFLNKRTGMPLVGLQT